MKGTTRNVLIAILCFYMAFTSIKLLVNTPFAEWGVEQYLLAVVSLGLVAVGLLRGKDVFFKKKGEAGEEEAEGEPQEVTAEMRELPEEAPAAEEDPADMDDLSDLEGVELLDVKTVIPDEAPAEQQD